MNEVFCPQNDDTENEWEKYILNKKKQLKLYLS